MFRNDSSSYLSYSLLSTLVAYLDDDLGCKKGLRSWFNVDDDAVTVVLVDADAMISGLQLLLVAAVPPVSFFSLLPPSLE